MQPNQGSASEPAFCDQGFQAVQGHEQRALLDFGPAN